MRNDVHTGRRIRVAAVNDYELIVSGLAQMLSAYEDRLLVCDKIIVGEHIENGPIDVALYDTYGRSGIVDHALEELLGSPHVHNVAMFTLDLRPELIEQARRAGVRAFVSKRLSCDEVVAAIEAAARGERVFAFPSDPVPGLGSAMDEMPWPGKDRGVSVRESEVLVLVGEGLTNREISDALYLSLETVKSHVSTVFAKLAVHNRVQAANYVSSGGAFSRYQPADPTEAGSSTSPG